MRFFQINNFTDKFGQVDYKTLDISLFVPGSQVYSSDITYCLVASNEDLPNLPGDVIELTEANYDTIKQSILLQNQENDPIKQLQSQNAQMLLALVNGGLM